MTFKSCLFNALIVAFFALVMGAIGFSVGSVLIGDYNPPWTHWVIEHPPQEAVDIVHIEIRSSLEDPAGDILYVAARNGRVFSKTLSEGKWAPVESAHDWDNSHIDSCAPAWPGPTEDHMWDPPPIEKGIIDSAGVRFERPISIISRCYVLLEDGSLEVWVHSGDGMSFFVGEMLKLVFAVPGVILGILSGGSIVLFRRKQGRTTPSSPAPTGALDPR